MQKANNHWSKAPLTVVEGGGGDSLTVAIYSMHKLKMKKREGEREGGKERITGQCGKAHNP